MASFLDVFELRDSVQTACAFFLHKHSGYAAAEIRMSWRKAETDWR